MNSKILKVSIILIFLPFLSIFPKDQSNLSINSSSIISPLSFSGYEWNVKNSAGGLWGPGPNFFNDSSQNVWLDSNGSLHLKITHGICVDQWYCAEIYSVESFGYGTYRFVLEPGYETMDKNIILGLFTYLDDTHEIDIEYAKWGNENAENGQFVLQPSWKLNHIKRYDFDPEGEESTHQFRWCENTIDFHAYGANIDTIPWRYYGLGIPKPSTEHVHMNLWLMSGLAPSDHMEQEVIIKSFEFLPSECLDDFIGFWWLVAIVSVCFLGVASAVVLAIRKKVKNR